MKTFKEGDVRIAKWYGNYAAAVSLRFDDSYVSHADVAVPLLEKFGFKATFMVNPGSNRYKTKKEFWEQKLSLTGNYLGNHTMHHQGAKDLSEAEYEIGETSRIIRLAQPKDSNILVFAAGGNTKWGGRDWAEVDSSYREIAAKYLLIDLYDGTHPSLSFRSSTKLADFCGMLDQAVKHGAHKAFVFHDIGSPSMEDYAKALLRGYHLTISEKTLEGFLQCLSERKNKLWIAPLVKILKYEKVTQIASLEKIESNSKSDVFVLSADTDPALYDQLLTIVLPFEKGKNSMRVFQNDKELEIYNGAKDEFLVDVEPKKSIIKVYY